jgi:hypothetical protein
VEDMDSKYGKSWIFVEGDSYFGQEVNESISIIYKELNIILFKTNINIINENKNDKLVRNRFNTPYFSSKTFKYRKFAIYNRYKKKELRFYAKIFYNFGLLSI